ncbi:MAG TPA: aminotransferase [Chloroflexi bacterium]|nr:aminotransferase [Chloroflexota bacterium]
MRSHYKDQFLLDPEVHFLNHGSFGACPKPVFETLIDWQKRLERQPIEVLDDQIVDSMKVARGVLAEFVHCPVDDLVFFPNPTTAVNMVARSLRLQPGDEILASNHEYGAMDRTWRFIARKSGARYVNHPLPLPVTTHEDFVETFWQGVSERTRVIFLSQITSQTALIFPVAEICRRARDAGILTIIDGAHAPGQIPLNLAEMAPDVYTGACHKWLCAPKGSAFLYARKEVQEWLEPLVVSWGYEAETPSGSQFVDHHEWQGTRDMSPFLSVPAAIDFQRQHDWDQVRSACHEMVIEARNRIHLITGLPKICPDGPQWLGQMAAIPLPKVNMLRLKQRLYREHRVEVPVYDWQGQPFLRISVQGYNTEHDLLALENALASLLPQEVLV